MMTLEGEEMIGGLYCYNIAKTLPEGFITQLQCARNFKMGDLI